MTLISLGIQSIKQKSSFLAVQSFFLCTFTTSQRMNFSPFKSLKKSVVVYLNHTAIFDYTECVVCVVVCCFT